MAIEKSWRLMSRFHHFSKVAILWLVLLGGLSGCNDPYSPLGWFLPASQTIHVLVPSGYEGPVLIAWEIPGGTVAEKQDDVFSYRLQEDGALLLQDVAPGFANWLFWYEDTDRQRIPIPFSTCFDNAQERGVVVCTGGFNQIWNGQELHPNQSFFVIKLKDKERVIGSGSNVVDSLLYKYADRLTIPDQ